MNIFYLDHDTKKCAEMHVDKHCVKMILEYAQLLSTTHRILDGQERKELTEKGRSVKRWVLSDGRNDTLYSATHVNHPSAGWTRHTIANYNWLFRMFIDLMREYTYRYGKIHSCARLIPYLKNPPTNIPDGEFTPPWRAMPDEFKVDGDTIQSYRNYYLGAKSSMFSWKKRNTPDWIAK